MKTLTATEMKKIETIARKQALTAMAKRFPVKVTEAKAFINSEMKREPNGDVATFFNKLVNDSVAILVASL